MTSANLFDLIAGRLRVTAGRPVILPPGGRALTGPDLIADAARMAGALVEAGVTPGDRVAVQVEKSVPVLALYLGTLAAGGVYLPLNTAYTGDEIAYFCGDADPRVLVVDPARESQVAGLDAARSASVLTLDASGTGTLTHAAAAALPLATPVPRAADDLAAILYTSGTTGRSKGAMLTHGNLASNAETLVGAWGITADDVLIHALPIFHVHGLFVAINTLLLAGGRIVYQSRFDPDAVLDAMADPAAPATMMMGVPTFYTRLLASPRLNREACRSMRLFISGSAPLLAETFRQFAEKTGHSILERYGMTETGMNASNPLAGERRPGTVGRALPGVELRVRTAEGDPVPPGAPGILEVRGPNVFKGYWQMPDKTAEAFRPDGFFVTGDIATIGADGYVAIVGRDKDLIISGGLNVYPKEVEDVIDRLPGVEESAVIGVPHPDFGEGVVAVVVPKSGEAAPEEAAIIAETRRRLAVFKTPKRVIVADALPRNTMGKVQKAALRKTHEGLFGGE